MTPVVPAVALRATSLDAALAATLALCDDPRSTVGVSGIVHSVHSRVVNVLFSAQLIALADDRIDDAPRTVRVAGEDWCSFHPRQGDRAHLTATNIRIESDGREWDIGLDAAVRWMPAPIDLARIGRSEYLQAHAHLSGARLAAPQTPFGRASAGFLDAGVTGLRDSAVALFSAGEEGAHQVITAVSRLVGLGEGLTPSGDDVLTGLSFLAAQPGSRIAALIGPLHEGIEAAAANTTLLSLTTMRVALQARGRQSMHDLVHALQEGRIEALQHASRQILAIGHTSGGDILTGIRLALELATIAHAPIHHDEKTRRV